MKKPRDEKIKPTKKVITQTNNKVKTLRKIKKKQNPKIIKHRIKTSKIPEDKGEKSQRKLCQKTLTKTKTQINKLKQFIAGSLIG